MCNLSKIERQTKGQFSFRCVNELWKLILNFMKCFLNSLRVFLLKGPTLFLSLSHSHIFCVCMNPNLNSRFLLDLNLLVYFDFPTSIIVIFSFGRIQLILLFYKTRILLQILQPCLWLWQEHPNERNKCSRR